MSFKITDGASGAIFLDVDSTGVEVGNDTERKRFRFSEIDCILSSPANMLSLQVGNEVFRVSINPDDPQHTNTVNFMVQEARRTTE